MVTYRQSNIKKNLELRAQIIQAVRQFFITNDYLEIETPYRIPSPAPEAHIDAEVSGAWVLHTSPELCMKRLLASGYTRLFQICKCFRQNERGSRHLPELTMLEWYTAGHNYLNMIEQCEELIQFIALQVNFGASLQYQGETIDLTTPWPRMSVSEAFNRYASTSMKDALSQGRFNDVIAGEIEPNLGRKKPLFLYDYPKAYASLARLKTADPSLAERFELYMGGIEICNAFSELTDAIEQKRRFGQELSIRSQFGKPIYPLPEKFLDALPRMPEAAGNALGIDRLVMIFADTTTIDDVVAFTPEEL
ncbi:MAG: EF-P lysine aminoacylase GenX [Desulfobacterales bacterium]|nr:MAG: EF-P lysine aminoacylase GenX [Desulfobacterales bacterium]UCD90678.1 MAG: EF-P lysine aminoacylase GenX [Desulfobacterales bacterium]